MSIYDKDIKCCPKLWTVDTYIDIHRKYKKDKKYHEEVTWEEIIKDAKSIIKECKLDY